VFWASGGLGRYQHALEVADGLPDADAQERLQDAVCEVLAENEESMMVFLRLGSQWNWAEGIRVGLNYPAAETVSRMTGVPHKKRHQLFDDLQILEGAALEYWDSKRRAQHGRTV